MGFDFTIALVPKGVSLEREMSYIKSALLYADKITLISPMAYVFERLTDDNVGVDERSMLQFIKQVVPLVKKNDPVLYENANNVAEQLGQILFSKKYKAIPYSVKVGMRQKMRKIVQMISEQAYVMVDREAGQDLRLLMKSGQVKVEKFQSMLDDSNSVYEYFRALKKALHQSYPLFDEQSNHLMKSAISSRIVNISDSDKRKITHAGLADNYLQRLPSFDTATMDELIDIKRELSDPLIRFRRKMFEYSEQIQTVPWDDDFETECEVLYRNEVAPAVLEIQEQTQDSCFLKNLGKKFFADENMLQSAGGFAGGLIVSIAAGGVISAFNDAFSSDTAMLTAGSAYAVSKIISSYNEYREAQKDIERKDLYFYYKAGEMLSK
ncbi:MAG: hypothetical protein IJQ81_07425 [Oscillibacter sp.]|nr:hypothetical protein [Oscillibacter sp.]